MRSPKREILWGTRRQGPSTDYFRFANDVVDILAISLIGIPMMITSIRELPLP